MKCNKWIAPLLIIFLLQLGMTVGKSKSKCKGSIIDCGCLSDPANGQVMLSGTSFESMAFYTCDTGFMINGASERECGSDGNWDGTAPTCDGPDVGSNNLGSGSKK